MAQSVYEYYTTKNRPTDPLEYADLAADSVDDLYVDQFVNLFREAAQTKSFSEFETVSFALAFVQSMRYTTDLESAARDEYPRYPLETLVYQGGDCEDVAILGAALITGLGYGAALLLFDRFNGDSTRGHAALGVAGTNLQGTYFERDGTRYYYTEMTNSGYEIGQVPAAVAGEKAHIIPIRTPDARAQANPSPETQPGATEAAAESTTQHLVIDYQIAIPAGSTYWYSFTLFRGARVDYSYGVIDDSSEDIGIIRQSDLQAYLDGNSVPAWAHHENVQSAGDSAQLASGNYDLVIYCRNSFADCDLRYSMSITG